MVTFDNLKLGIFIAARYCGLALLRTQNVVPKMSAITRIDCTLCTNPVPKLNIYSKITNDIAEILI